MESLKKISPEEAHALIRELTLKSERAFRRGFAHGVSFSKKFGVTEAQADKFRYQIPINQFITPPMELDARLDESEDSSGELIAHHVYDGPKEDFPLINGIYRISQGRDFKFLSRD